MDKNNKITTRQLIKMTQNIFGEDLKSIIVSGSFSFDYKIDSWKDMDILLVLDNLTYDSCKKSSSLFSELINSYGLPVGLDTVSSDEVEANISLLNSHSKTIQTLYEASLFPNKIIFKTPNLNLSIPDTDIVKEMSDRMVTFFYFDLRKILTRNITKDSSEIKETLRIVIRRLFNMTKMALQYITLTPSQSKSETITLFEKVFSDMQSDTLKELVDIVNQWNSIDGVDKIHKSLNSIFVFSEVFFFTYQINKHQLEEKFK